MIPMERFRHPSYPFIVTLLASVFALFDVFFSLGTNYGLLFKPYFIVPVGIVIISLGVYLFFALFDFLYRYILSVCPLRSFFFCYRHNLHFRRIVNSYVGAIGNYLLLFFYLILSYIYNSYFYGLCSQFFFTALLSRQILLWMTFSKKERKPHTGLVISSFFMILLGMELTSIIILSRKYGIVLKKNPLIVYVMAIYGMAKLVSSIYSFIKSRKNHDFMILPYSMISLALAFYSVFMLAITIPISLKGETGNAYTYTGLPLGFILFVIGTASLVFIARLKIKEKRKQ